jgi:hypothetical protein
MSRVFNNTSDLNGLVQEYEKEIGVDYGFVSGNTTRLKAFASATRTAWDKYIYFALKASGKWQFDDSNQTDFPIVYTNIVSGQQSYPFVLDEQGNLILDIYKVAVLPSATATEYVEITPIDAQSEEGGVNLVAETSQTGTPYQYDKTANGIFLDTTPNYNATRGLKIYINREASYFTSTDTTKKPGCPGVHHDYFFLRPAFENARRNNLSNYTTLRDEILKYEGDEERGIVGSIERYFSRRSRDERGIITGKKIKYI